MRQTKHLPGFITALLTIALMAGATVVAAQTQEGVQQHDRDRTRDQLRTKINEAAGLTDGQRREMQTNLDACIELGIVTEQTAAMFPDGASQRQLSASVMLRLQNRVLNMARDGATIDPVLNKIREGRTKGAPEPALEFACERMENNARSADRVMQGLAAEGMEPSQEAMRRKAMHGEISQQMWRGMNEQGYTQLRERARKQTGECSADDVVAASEVAVRFIEANVDRGRAIDFAGAALEHGYRSQEMRQIQMMVAARQQRGEAMDEFINGMEHCVGAGMGPGEMYSYMIRHGWMGPSDMYSPGGHQPAAPKGHGTGGSKHDDKGNKGGGVR